MRGWNGGCEDGIWEGGSSRKFICGSLGAGGKGLLECVNNGKKNTLMSISMNVYLFILNSVFLVLGMHISPDICPSKSSEILLKSLTPDT